MLASLLSLAVLAAGCGEATTAPRPSTDGTGTRAPSTADPSADPPNDANWLVGVGTVLDDGDGPELCLGGVADSLPPQCGGPKVAGWDWSTVEDKQSRSGTIWADGYVLTGTFDGDVFTLAKPPVTLEEYDGPRQAEPDDGGMFSTPCPEPAGGWRPVDLARTTQTSLDQVAVEANRLDGFADLWWDQSINDSGNEFAMNDPQKLIVNVRVVGDTKAAETALRQVWGGALCVTQAQRTRAELSKIQREVNDTPGMLFSDAGRDVVDVQVIHDDGSLQRRMDEEYGPGVVRVESALVPLRQRAD
ncbi:MAG: hypothetical protein H0V42_05710 [Nocardioidaceae bacterium]|nr:hypothetical protein [Nocardioidaceae bacterium]